MAAALGAELTFNAVTAAWNASSDKWANGVTDAGVRDVLRSGHDKKDVPTPYVVVEFHDRQSNAVTNKHIDGVLTLHIFTRQDRGFADQNAIVSGMYGSLQGLAAFDATGVLKQPERLDGGQAPSDGTLNHAVERYAIYS